MSLLVTMLPLLLFLVSVQFVVSAATACKSSLSLMTFCLLLLLLLCGVFLLPLAVTMTTSEVFALPVAAAELQHSALNWQSPQFGFCLTILLVYSILFLLLLQVVLLYLPLF